MITYIIHCSLIWTIALLVYELWLQRTTFHAANRWYLNISLLLGLLLPLYRPAVTHTGTVRVLELQLRELAIREQRLEVIGRQADDAFNLTTVLLAAAVAGALIQLVRILWEGIVLLRLRRNAVRSLLNGYTVYVTGAAHGPFSAFGAIYITDIKAYAERELRFILAHESAHIRLRHSADKCAVLVLRCLFWWHPLVYVFYARLSLVQEFQADQPLQPYAPAYGRFLIDESLVERGVGITHQFFHSPLKTRIRMLHRFATRNWQKAGYIAALTLLAGGSFLWTNKSIAQKEERQGNVIVFNGNRFETGVRPLQMQDGSKVVLGDNVQIEVAEVIPDIKGRNAAGFNAIPDSTQVRAEPAVKLGTPFKVQLNPIPLRMNGETIYEIDALDQQAALPDGSGLEQALIEGYMPSLAKLADGRYELGMQMVVSDARGKLVYYKTSPVSWLVLPAKERHSIEAFAKRAEEEKKAHAIDPGLAARLSDELEAGLATLRLNPPLKGGKPVIGYVPVRSANVMYVAEVRNGKVRAVNIGAR